MSREPREASEPAAPPRTLFLASANERRHAPARAGGTGASSTSDVRRFRGVLFGASLGAACVAIAAILAPPPGGLRAPGPLARPHAEAHVRCADCHDDANSIHDAKAARAANPARDGASNRPVANAACVHCHGAHPSTRPGHARALADGSLGCASCHRVHTSEGGVTFGPSGPASHFGPGRAEPVDVAFHPAQATTVALVRAAACAHCHDTQSPRDPIARCLIHGQEALGDARPVVCFDEHQPAFVLPTASVPKPAGSCAAQHTADRPLAWEAARVVAASAPRLPPGPAGGSALFYLAVGLAAAGAGTFSVRARDRLRQRRRASASKIEAEALVRAPDRVRLPQIDASTCLGCSACVDACPYDVFEIERYVARVVRPEACCGLLLCEQRCPNGSLRVTDGEPIGDRPRLGDSLECLDADGVYLAGDVTGLPLIKNAIHQGALAASHIAERLAKSKPSAGALDLVIVGAGPAGISAALRAKELGLSFEVVEQGTVAQSIQSFPRGKLVFDQPLDLPVAGKLWLEESTKEELLAQWMRIVRREALPIRQDTRMVSIARESSGLLAVAIEPREGGAREIRRARAVLLAIGQRGSPRRLPFELRPEAEPIVHYHLFDAQSFAGRRVVVVGLGDVAMEAAIALARQPDTEVTVVHRGKGFSRGKKRNVDAVRRLVDAGRVALRFETRLVDVGARHVMLEASAGRERVDCEAVFVLIGSIPPWDTLRAAGVRTVADGPRPDAARQIEPEARP